MAGFFEWKKQLLKMMDQSRKLAVACGFAVAADNIADIRADFESRELLVVAVGEARRGKSSLMNMLLNQKEPLFPVDINVCTNVVTIVRYGETEKISAVMEQVAQDSNGQWKQVRKEITRAEIGDYVSEKGNPDNFKNIAALEIQIPNDLLRDGVVFVDTPGVGSMNVNHAQVTYGFLPNADLLLFVGDAVAGFTETELDFLKRGYQYCKNVVFPLTKKDLNAEYQTIADDNRAKISAACGIGADEVQIIPVSSKAKERWLDTGRKSLYRNSNYEELERVMWESIIRVQADRLLLPYAAAVGAELDKVQEGIAAQYQLLHADKEKSEELIQALSEEKERFSELQESSAEWKNSVQLFFMEQGNGFNSQIQDLSYRLQNRMTETIQSLNEQICQEENYSRMLAEMNEEISRRVLQMKEDFQQALSVKLRELEESLSLNMDVNQSALGKIDFQGDDSLPITFREKKMGDKLIGKGRTISGNALPLSYIGTAAGGIIGAAAGFFLGGPVGAVGFAMKGAAIGGTVGTAAGIGKGCMESLKDYDVSDISTVKTAFTQYISLTIGSLNKMFSAVNQEMKAETVLLLDKELKKRSKEIQESIARMNQNLSASKSGAQEKKKLLQQQNAQVKKAGEQWATAYSKISAQWAAKADKAAAVQPSAAREGAQGAAAKAQAEAKAKTAAEAKAGAEAKAAAQAKAAEEAKAAAQAKAAEEAKAAAQAKAAAEAKAAAGAKADAEAKAAAEAAAGAWATEDTVLLAGAGVVDAGVSFSEQDAAARTPTGEKDNKSAAKKKDYDFL